RRPVALPRHGPGHRHRRTARAAHQPPRTPRPPRGWPPARGRRQHRPRPLGRGPRPPPPPRRRRLTAPPTIPDPTRPDESGYTSASAGGGPARVATMAGSDLRKPHSWLVV